jgi:hypothetical protein
LAVVAVTAVAILVLIVGVPTAGAEASGNASCVGIEASSISPPGSSEEFPGGVPALIRLVRSAAGNVGPIISSVAKLHEGSHEACDEATEG